MSNLSTFLFIFIGILVVAGWVSSEMISSKATRANKKASLRSAKLEKENDQLTQAMSRETERYNALRKEYDIAKEARDQLKDFEREYKKLLKSYNNFSTSIDSLTALVSAKKYGSNALSREVLAHINEHCPSQEKRDTMKEESTKAVFKRIKDRMGGT